VQNANHTKGTAMKHESISTEAREQYKEAYSAHYSERNMRLAFQLYKNLMTSHPDALEAEYSRAQVQNIVNTVVPKQELLNLQLELVLVQFDQDQPLNSGQVSSRPAISDLAVSAADKL